VRTDIPKECLINKTGHALHFLDPVFTAYSQSPKVKELVRSLGYRDPVLPQSMYIFKQGKIGGEVTSHQAPARQSALEAPRRTVVTLAVVNCSVTTLQRCSKVAGQHRCTSAGGPC